MLVPLAIAFEGVGILNHAKLSAPLPLSVRPIPGHLKRSGPADTAGKAFTVTS